MKRLAMLLGCALALAACDQQAYLVITLNSAVPIHVTSLDITVESAGQTGTATLTREFSLPPEHTFVIALDDQRTGATTVMIVAKDSGTEVGRGTGVVTVPGAGKVFLDINLTGGPPADLGHVDQIGADLAGADLATPPDLATPEDLVGADLAAADLAMPADMVMLVDAAMASDLAAQDAAVAMADMVKLDQVPPADFVTVDHVPPADLVTRTITFSSGQTFAATIVWAALAQIDDDGKLDLVVSTDAGVFWIQGNGDGTFDTTGGTGGLRAISDLTGASFRGVAVGPLNNDGFNDVAAAFSTTGTTAYVALTSAAATFGATSTKAAGGDVPRPIAVLDNNGTHDLVLGSMDNANASSLNWLAGDGMGGFATVQQYDSCVDPRTIVTGDLNSDSRDEVVLACTGTSGDTTKKPGVYVHQANASTGAPSGTMTQLSYPNFASAIALESAELVNVTGNANLDIVAAADNGEVVVFPGSGGGAFGSPLHFASGVDQPKYATAGDIDGDGVRELIVAGAPGGADGGVSILRFDGASFTLPSADARLDKSASYNQVFVVDLDGDNLPEIIGVGASGFHVLLNTSAF